MFTLSSSFVQTLGHGGNVLSIVIHETLKLLQPADAREQSQGIAPKLQTVSQRENDLAAWKSLRFMRTFEIVKQKGAIQQSLV